MGFHADDLKTEKIGKGKAGPGRTPQAKALSTYSSPFVSHNTAYLIVNVF